MIVIVLFDNIFLCLFDNIFLFYSTIFFYFYRTRSVNKRLDSPPPLVSLTKINYRVNGAWALFVYYLDYWKAVTTCLRRLSMHGKLQRFFFKVYINILTQEQEKIILLLSPSIILARKYVGFQLIFTYSHNKLPANVLNLMLANCTFKLYKNTTFSPQYSLLSALPNYYRGV